MRASLLTKCALAVAASIGLLSAPLAGHTPEAHAAPYVPHLPTGPLDASLPNFSYAMGDSLNCFIDYAFWVQRDKTNPARVLAHVQALHIRPTIPGPPPPATCSATLVISSNTDRDWIGEVDQTVRLDAVGDGGPQASIAVPYQPDANWVDVYSDSFIKKASRGLVAASPCNGVVENPTCGTPEIPHFPLR